MNFFNVLPFAGPDDSDDSDVPSDCEYTKKKELKEEENKLKSLRSEIAKERKKLDLEKEQKMAQVKKQRRGENGADISGMDSFIVSCSIFMRE